MANSPSPFAPPFSTPFWPFDLYLPFSGATQSINPGWFNTTITYAGDAQIESRVISDVASYGKQIGILSEALLELAGADAHGEAVERLRTVVAEIEAIKRRHRERIADRVTDALQSLERLEPAKADLLLDEIERRISEARGQVQRKRHGARP